MDSMTESIDEIIVGSLKCIEPIYSGGEPKYSRLHLVGDRVVSSKTFYGKAPIEYLGKEVIFINHLVKRNWEYEVTQSLSIGNVVKTDDGYTQQFQHEKKVPSAIIINRILSSLCD
jgi:hypothetical protein